MKFAAIIFLTTYFLMNSASAQTPAQTPMPPMSREAAARQTAEQEKREKEMPTVWSRPLLEAREPQQSVNPYQVLTLAVEADRRETKNSPKFRLKLTFRERLWREIDMKTEISEAPVIITDFQRISLMLTGDDLTTNSTAPPDFPTSIRTQSFEAEISADEISSILKSDSVLLISGKINHVISNAGKQYLRDFISKYSAPIKDL